MHKNTREITNHNESKAELYQKKSCEEEVYEEVYDDEKDFQNEIKLSLKITRKYYIIKLMFIKIIS